MCDLVNNTGPTVTDPHRRSFGLWGINTLLCHPIFILPPFRLMHSPAPPRTARLALLSPDFTFPRDGERPKMVKNEKRPQEG